MYVDATFIANQHTITPLKKTDKKNFSEKEMEFKFFNKILKISFQ